MMLSLDVYVHMFMSMSEGVRRAVVMVCLKDDGAGIFIAPVSRYLRYESPCFIIH